jgi:uncharacterized protein
MTGPFAPRVGGVLSADIAVPDHERGVRFYSQVLSTGEHPLWGKDLMNNLGLPIIGLGARTPEYERLPLQWMPHIQVADVATSVARALETGGSQLMHAQGEDGASQWAVLLDPNGAAFGLIPVVTTETISEEVASRAAAESVGRIAWLDLTVRDATSTREFYREVVGWSVEDVEMNDGSERYADYNMLGEDGTPVAGVCHARGPNVGLPPVWMIYLPVGDLAESLRRAEEEGGKILNSMKKDDGDIAYAAVQDPAGACFALVPG